MADIHVVVRLPGPRPRRASPATGPFVLVGEQLASTATQAAAWPDVTVPAAPPPEWTKERDELLWRLAFGSLHQQVDCTSGGILGIALPQPTRR